MSGAEWTFHFLASTSGQVLQPAPTEWPAMHGSWQLAAVSHAVRLLGGGVYSCHLTTSSRLAWVWGLVSNPNEQWTTCRKAHRESLQLRSWSVSHAHDSLRGGKGQNVKVNRLGRRDSDGIIRLHFCSLFLHPTLSLCPRNGIFTNRLRE